MKKSIIALMGLFVLVACSDDSYQEADKMSETGTVENTELQNSVKTIDLSIPYESPFDRGLAGSPMVYSIHNNTSFILSVTPYVGLAYFDGTDDGFYYSANITTGNFPNLYNGSKEYLNLLKCPPMELNPITSLDGPAYDHLSTINPNHVFYDVVGGGGTLDEATLLQDYGKVYYYEVTVMLDDDDRTVVYSGVVRPKFDHPSPPAPWNSLGLTSIFSDDLYFHTSSQEIVMVSTSTPDQLNFTYLGSNYYIKMATDQVRTLLEVQ